MISTGDIIGKGGILPSEEKLCQSFQVSRITVRKALAQLVLDGLIYRKSGKGTFVLPEKKETFSVHLTADFDQTVAVGLRASMKLFTQRNMVAPSSVCSKLGLKNGERVFYYEGLRLAGNEPYAFFQAFVSTLIGKIFTPAELKGAKAIFKMLEEIQGIRFLEAERTITASLADRKTAKHLKIELGDPILLVEGLYFSQERRPMELGISYFRPDRYQYQLKLIKERSSRTENHWGQNIRGLA